MSSTTRTTRSAGSTWEPTTQRAPRRSTGGCSGGSSRSWRRGGRAPMRSGRGGGGGVAVAAGGGVRGRGGERGGGLDLERAGQPGPAGRGAVLHRAVRVGGRGAVGADPADRLHARGAADRGRARAGAAGGPDPG